jgi:hypothetical protein
VFDREIEQIGVGLRGCSGLMRPVISCRRTMLAVSNPTRLGAARAAP